MLVNPGSSYVNIPVSAGSLAEDPASSPRIWQRRERKENKWKDIRVIDGDVLVEWLSNSAIVSQEVARLTGRKINGALESIEVFWNNWSIGPEKLRITPKLICAGRKREAETLVNRLRGGAEVIPVQAATKEEVIAFIAAVMLLFENDQREKMLAKTIVVANLEDFNIVLNDHPSIIIPLFNHSSVLYSGPQKNHHILVPLGADDKNDSDKKISLPKLGREEILEGLRELGLSEEQARSPH